MAVVVVGSSAQKDDGCSRAVVIDRLELLLLLLSILLN